MTSISLNSPYVAEGIETVSFWNGRVLTAEDLRDEQHANAAHRGLLGQAIGDGVVTGFEISVGAVATTVDVQPGLAVNRLGETISLAEPVDVSLVGSGSITTNDSGFGTCETVVSLEGTGTGLYVLLAGPATDNKDFAPKVPIGGNGSASECGPRYSVDGVTFALVALKASTLVEDSDFSTTDITSLSSASDDQSHSRLRSLAANLLNGAAALKTFYAEPDDATTTYGPLDLVRQATAPAITDRDVPIALIFWEGSGVAWTDMWSVRRRPTVPESGSEWTVPVAARRLAEGQAAYLQFIEHAEWLAAALSRSGASPTVEAAVATDWFEFLPAAGAIPMFGLHDSEPASGPGGVRGFTFGNFFKGLPVRPSTDAPASSRPLFVSRSRAETLLRTSFTYAAIPLSSGLMHWVYAVEENRAAAVDPSAEPAAPYAVFTTGQMPYMADGQFDLTRWDLGNYGFGDVPEQNGA